MGAPAQLLLLLWKCWKTTLRSPGWTIVQCLFTFILWAILIFAILKVNAEFYDDISKNKEDTYIYEKLSEYETEMIIQIGCDGPCNETVPDLQEAADRACPQNTQICTMAEHPVQQPWPDNAFLKLHDLSDDPPGLKVDFLRKSEISCSPMMRSCECKEFGESSEQFDHSWYYSCGPSRVIRPLMAFAGGNGQFNLNWITKTTDDRTSEITTLRISAIIIFYSIPLVLFCAQATREVSEETANNMKDYLLSMGMSRAMYYLHHFIYTYLKAWISVAGFSFIFACIFGAGMGFMLLLLFSLALASWVGMALVVGALLKKPGTSTFVNFMLSIALIFMSFFINVKRTNILLTMFVSMFPQFAVRLAFDSMREGDFRGYNIAFADAGHAVQYGFIVMLMVLSAVFYTGLAILMDLILAALENPMTLIRRAKIFDSTEDQIIADNHEEMSNGESPAVVVEGVHKMYPMGEYAVRGVHLNMFRGQVTALLGHNGAGKSTLFSMISGMSLPSKGNIRIMESSKRSEQQQLIGYCPQYNAIFPKLTVDEHLQFFARLKGTGEWEGTGQRVLSILGMADKGAAKAAELSGGMKRKLGIAIALAANSPIVLLDEPTAGMDTGARRDFERLLMEWKKEHAILLTTHYTDEAEMLADRIFIMANGRVFCSGSTQFLRKRFISGCILSFTAYESIDATSAAGMILEAIQEFAPDSHIERIRGQQFDLKLNSDDKSRHAEMFRMIEAVSDQIGIASYSLSLTKLEQVFLKVGEMTGTKSRNAEIATAIQQLIEENDNRSQIPQKIGVQMLYLFLKRIHYDFAHLPSLAIRLALISIVAIFAVSTLLEKITSGGPTHSSENLLVLPDCYRVGLHSSLHSKAEEFVRAAKEAGYCLTFHTFQNTTDEWFESTSMVRPPILGALSDEGANGWTMHTFARNERLLPALETVAAMANRPELKNVQYNMITPDSYAINADVNNTERAKMAKLAFVPILLACTSLMATRPMGFHIVDATSHYAHQQRLTGVYRVTILLATIIYDGLTFALHSFFFFLPLMITHMSVLNGSTAESLLIPLISFIQAEFLTLLSYRIFATRAKGESLLTFALFILTLLSIGAIAAFTALGELKWLLVHPSAALAAALNAEELCKIQSMMQNPNVTLPSWESQQSTATSLIFVHLLLLLIPLLCVEFRVVERLRAHFARKREAAERGIEQVPFGSDADTILKVRNLHKHYGLFTKFPAVNGISFDVRAHECFGVLGVNGAGKTSTFEILTGNTAPTKGYATVGGVDCSAPATIGYCPQIDALIDDLSGFQSLVVLAALHGYTNPRKVANILIECVGMKKHAHKSSKQYSGGQRRKISVAAALLAQNSLIILDEPTAGIDPVARRDVWNVICALREATNTAVVLTSHSMDEVETLVSTLIIMCRGQIAVMGTPQSVKNQFGAHYELCVTTRDSFDVDEITRVVRAAFPSAELLDSGSSWVFKFRIARRPDDLFSAVYQRAEEVAEILNATDFYITQATLEDAFVLAANMPIDQSPSVTFNPKTDEVRMSRFSAISRRDSQ